MRQLLEELVLQQSLVIRLPIDPEEGGNLRDVGRVEGSVLGGAVQLDEELLESLFAEGGDFVMQIDQFEQCVESPDQVAEEADPQQLDDHDDELLFCGGGAVVAVADGGERGHGPVDSGDVEVIFREEVARLSAV